MTFKQPHPALDKNQGGSKRIHRLNSALVVLALLCYALYVTGDYFVPVKSPLWLGGAVFLLVAGVIYKIANSRGLTLAGLRGWLAANWPVLILLAALLGGGILRYQALKTHPNTPGAPTPAAVQAFATEARNIINNSDWQPQSYEQPPLYLYGGAVVTELLFFQQASTGKIDSPGKVTNQDILDFLTYVNLLLGLLTIVIVFTTASRWWQSRTAGAIAAGLTGMAWLAYQATPNPASQLLAATLASLSFLFMTYVGGKLRWPVFWAGMLAGLATGAAYGAFLTLIPLIWLVATRTEGRWKKIGLGLGGWLLGWTLACPGWILSLHRFVAGLNAIGPAPDAALNSYFQQFFSYDLGLLAVFLVTLVCAAIWRKGWGKLWPVLAVPLLYFLILNISGPVNVTRLALVTPWLALAMSGPLTETVAWLQNRLPARFRQNTWTRAALTLLGLMVVLAISILGRRFFA